MDDEAAEIQKVALRLNGEMTEEEWADCIRALKQLVDAEHALLPKADSQA